MPGVKGSGHEHHGDVPRGGLGCRYGEDVGDDRDNQGTGDMEESLGKQTVGEGQYFGRTS